MCKIKYIDSGDNMNKKRLKYQLLPYIALVIVFSACSILAGPSDSPEVDEVVVRVLNGMGEWMRTVSFLMERAALPGTFSQDGAARN